MLYRLLWIAIAGAAGSLCRFGTYELVDKLAPEKLSRTWHISTLIVNVLGCFVYGFLVQWLTSHASPESNLKLILLTGFLGAYTTYSTFAFDTYDLHHSTGLAAALGFMALQVATGWGAMIAGVAIGRAL
jgi:fluoride exporter